MQKISVIIPVEPQGSASVCIESLKKVDWDKKNFEVLLCRGTNPARQRNKAAVLSRGDILFFLDSDSMAEEDLFKKNTENYLNNSEAVCCGGPALVPSGVEFPFDLFDAVLSSFWGTCFSSSRYRSSGRRRAASERELISCNLSIKKDVFEENGGFCEKLFPNEENELLQRLKKKGLSLIYDPEAKVYRYPEKTLLLFLKHIFNYGRGRMEQFFIKKHPFFIFNLLPFLLLCDIVSLFFYSSFFFVLPAAVYGLLSLFFSFQGAWLKKKPLFLLFLPPLFLLFHLSYGAGIFFGLFTALFKKNRNFFGEDNIIVQKIKNFNEELF